MENQPEPIDLNNKTADFVILAVKGALGAIPFVGSLLAELAGTVIPNQREDRIVRFAQLLEERIIKLEQDYVRSQLNNEYFCDLFEEGVRQASRSLSDERRIYIANLITNSLEQPDIEYIESKHLMRMLNELNDIEIIWLRFYINPGMSGDDEFRNAHKELLTPIRATHSSPKNAIDKEALQDSYKDHLTQLGLLRPQYKVDNMTKLPKFNSHTGNQELNGHEITPLGRLLLKQIGLVDFD